MPLDSDLLPAPLRQWFAARGWTLRDHQRAMLEAAAGGQSALLIAPTGGGKTLAGFLPSLADLTRAPREGLHTLYISPLKALAVDVHRNLEQPIAEAGLPVSHETRTGDTPAAKRQRQRTHPPNLLMTTPESLALMLSYPDAPRLFGDLAAVVVDELHALAGTKRGDQLALCLARLRALRPQVRAVGLSATVAQPEALACHVAPDAVVIRGAAGATAEVGILDAAKDPPWAGHMAHHAMPEVMDQIRSHRTTLVFVNTRAQGEIVFQALWRLNDEALPIALHHGSLAAEQRRKVEAAMAAGKLRAVVATSSLDLGIDWGAVDLVIQIGAPKGSARMIQRIGRANHRLDAPSQALLVPGNRFEYLECEAALDAMRAGELDDPPPRAGALDVLAQHVLGVACAGAFHPDDLFAEVRTAAPYADLDRETFDGVLRFVKDGGYALKTYDQYRRLAPLKDGRFKIANPRFVRDWRMNVGTIVEAETLKVRLGRGPYLGEVEEYFVMGLAPGDTFIFAGQTLRFEGVREMTVIAAKAQGQDPKVPAYMGGRLPISARLADRVVAILSDPVRRARLPAAVRDWADIQEARSTLPRPGTVLVETFPRRGRAFLVAYSLAGRNAHQTLGMLLTRRMERLKLKPLGFVANDYAIAVWSAVDAADHVERLFDYDILGDDLEEWMAESPMLKRAFRQVAVIAGLVQRRIAGAEKSGRQVTFNSDLIYDVLRKYEPEHVLLRATRADAEGGLIDLHRLTDMLYKAQGNIEHRRLARVSPLAVPVLLDIGKESMAGAILDDLLDEAAADLIAEAVG
ncbi:ligase-associated DNA damage response DEXH box helicase [Caenispirillum bisanense]|uniref:ATP-dependent helicase Lhr and Lhr-like helicase n=1 Tax=Caenispirillum bisanense TaxID=414052 RepID=A0A286GNR4_9PROT|nr:ligase-associated DNA damage response DEXH box helicase [Caenispirillum bisanense]SOD97185.1 ATP-dependent helicase Lhr and Lhr-like helicase [Caenispirillum bisanense]